MTEPTPRPTRRPTRRSTRRAAMLAATCLIPILAARGLAAQTVATAEPATVAPADAVTVLLQQAAFWSSQQKFDQARASLQRVLRIEPGNVDALAALAQLEISQGNRGAAEAARARLRAVAPDDSRLPNIGGAIRVGPIAPPALEEARRLAREGQFDQAVAQYDRIFRGNAPPAALAVEYFRVLSATSGGWEAARDGLAALVRQDPADLPAQLAYAEILTYREGARADGIERLRTLAANPAVSQPATKAWRAALGWLPATPESEGPLGAYLALHPDDAELTSRLAAARNPPTITDPAAQARLAGFDQLNAGKLADAAASFQQALAANPEDADALGGLGLARLRQRDLAAAKTLLARAVALDPDHADRWNRALAASRAPSGEPNPATALMARGDFAAAERSLQGQIARSGRDPGLLVMLAEAQARQGHLPEAEESYRDAIARGPGNGAALVGLATLLASEGRAQDASDLLRQARAEGAAPLAARAEAGILRDQAAAARDPQARLALLRAASAQAPDNPWVSLDLARELAREGRLPEARAIMARAVAGGGGVDALRAGILFANETNDPDAASLLLARLPARARTPDMRAAQARAALRQQIAAASALDPLSVRERLLALAAGPDPDGLRGSSIAHVLTGGGPPDAAREAIATAMAATPGSPPAARLAYAGALMEAGDAVAAQRMLAGLSGAPGLSPQQRADLAQLRGGLAVRRADALNEQGRQDAAFDALAPALAARPADADLNLALARLYQGAKRPRDALAINEAVLRRDPANAGARQAAVDAALAADERDHADQLARDGLRLTPSDPRSWVAAANVARARGDNEQALRDLRRARALRTRQLDATQLDAAQGGAGDEAVTGLALAMGDPQDFQPPLAAPPLLAAPASYPPNPFTADLPEMDADGDLVMVRRHMLDTSATDLPPPRALAARAGTQTPAPFFPESTAPPPAGAAPAPPRQITMTAASPSSDTDGSQGALIDTNPFGRAAPPPAPAAALANPFRGPALSPAPAPTLLADTAPLAAPTDPLTARIDTDIAALTDQVSPGMQAAVGFRGRSGSAGTSQLAEITVPLEATFSPGGEGRIKLAVTPTFLTAGTVPGDTGSQSQFGTLALGPRAGHPSVGSQTADGAGLDVGYAIGSFSADIGSTPLGFQQQNVVGGLEWAPTLTEGVRLRLTGERRAVTDSILSYAGTQDPQSGAKWGGVTYARGHANLEFSAGPADLYVGGGGGELQGQNVKTNTEIEAGAGGSVPLWKTPTQELRLGVDLVYFAYAKNLGGFTLGQGGYFSPQSYFAALLPVTYKEQATPDLYYEVGGTVGLQTYREDSSPYYPNNADLQSALVAQQANPATSVQGVATAYPSQSQTGFTGGAHGLIDYRLTPSFHIGAKVDYEHSGNFNQTVGLLYGRYVFNGAAPK